VEHLCVDVQQFIVIAKFDRFFKERCGFAGQHGLVDDAGTAEEEVGGDGSFSLETDEGDEVAWSNSSVEMGLHLWLQ
jgi:hypothetical protein